MSRARRDPHKAKLRRDQVKRKTAAGPSEASPPPEAFPYPQHPFASERAMREIHTLLEGQQFDNIDQVNARLEELTRGGRISDIAGAWKRDDPKWRAQQLAYDALETDSLEEALRLCNEALQLDPDCIDAQRLMVSVGPLSPENRLHLIRDVVSRAERLLGEPFFEKNAGHFWGIIETRPYMRAMQQLGELLAEAGDLEAAIAVFERMLELNTTDNQGMRYPLLGLCLTVSRLEGARDVMSRYPEETVLGSFAWARVLERWLAGELDEAQAALARARKVNAFVESYASGARAIPRQTPEFYRPGDDSEAQVCAREFASAWRRHSGFRQWLRAQK
jgi:tetratricopeptide (TPR) repeat protein